MCTTVPTDCIALHWVSVRHNLDILLGNLPWNLIPGRQERCTIKKKNWGRIETALVFQLTKSVILSVCFPKRLSTLDSWFIRRSRRGSFALHSPARDLFQSMDQLCSAVSHYGFSHILHPSLPPSETRFVYLDLGVVSKSAAAGARAQPALMHLLFHTHQSQHTHPPQV